MTNKKAIKWLKLELEKGVSWDDTSESTKNIREQAEVEIKEAFDMAIKALEQQPCDDWYDVPSDEMTLEQARQAVKDLRKKLAEYLEQNPCEDVPDTNVGDIISRQAVDELSKELVHTTRDKADFLCNFWEGLQKLPPVTPKEKIGWIPISERLPEDYGEYICTMSNDNVQECGFVPSGEKGLIAGWSTCEADGFKKLDYQDVIAWMPLPAPFEPQESEVQK